MGIVRYPNPPEATDEALRRQWGELIRLLEIRDAKQYALNESPYVVTNVSIQRNYDSTTASIGNTMTVLATLIQDLKNKGIIG